MHYPKGWVAMSLCGTLMSLCVVLPATVPATPTVDPTTWLAVSIPVASLLYGAVFYAAVWRHAERLRHDVATERRPVPAAATKEVRRVEKAVFNVMDRLEELQLQRLPATADNSPAR
jgi:hypothetical protein